jgi:hypothetical protein
MSVISNSRSSNSVEVAGPGLLKKISWAIHIYLDFNTQIMHLFIYTQQHCYVWKSYWDNAITHWNNTFKPVINNIIARDVLLGQSLYLSPFHTSTINSMRHDELNIVAHRWFLCTYLSAMSSRFNKVWMDYFYWKATNQYPDGLRSYDS